jgi:hypothetical protein
MVADAQYLGAFEPTQRDFPWRCFPYGLMCPPPAIPTPTLVWIVGLQQWTTIVADLGNVRLPVEGDDNRLRRWSRWPWNVNPLATRLACAVQ